MKRDIEGIRPAPSSYRVQVDRTLALLVLSRLAYSSSTGSTVRLRLSQMSEQQPQRVAQIQGGCLMQVPHTLLSFT
jgi:hypothetical protein